MDEETQAKIRAENEEIKKVSVYDLFNCLNIGKSKDS